MCTSAVDKPWHVRQPNHNVSWNIWFSKCTSTKVSALINSVKTCWHLPLFFQKAFVEIPFLDKKLSWHHVHLKNSSLKCRFGNKLVAGRESKYLTNEMLLKVCRVNFHSADIDTRLFSDVFQNRKPSESSFKGAMKTSHKARTTKQTVKKNNQLRKVLFKQPRQLFEKIQKWENMLKRW